MFFSYWPCWALAARWLVLSSSLETWTMCDQEFDAWMVQVDREIAVRLGGLTSEDIEDYDYMALFEDELSPAEAAEEVLEANLAEYGWSL